MKDAVHAERNNIQEVSVMDKNDSFTPEEDSRNESSKNENQKVKNGKKKNRQTVMSSLMMMSVLLIAVLYVMINLPGNLVVLMVVAAMFLGSAYLFGKAIVKEIHDSSTRAAEQYEAIEKSGKASYILIKKTMEQLSQMQVSTQMPTEDIITAQKAIAKVTINRSKENTDALMNSNDRVLAKIYNFEESFGNNQNDLLDRQRQLMDDSMKELKQQQQEMASTMKSMEQSIKNELLHAMNTMQAVPQQIEQPEMPEMPIQQIEQPEMPEMPVQQIEMPVQQIEQPEMPEEEVSAEEFDFSGPMLAAEEASVTENIDALEAMDLGFGDDVNLEDNFESTDDLNLDFSVDMSLGDDISLDEDMELNPNLSLDEDMELNQNLTLEEGTGFGEDLDFGEPSLSADIDLGIDLITEEKVMEAESAAEEPIAEEPEFVKEEAAMPDLSDPHKMMTPEEIAALIANM